MPAFVIISAGMEYAAAHVLNKNYVGQQCWRGTCTLRGIRSRLALTVEGLARVSKNAGGRPRLASVAFDGRYMGLAL